MRIETEKSHDDVAQPRPKVWLSRADYEELQRRAESFRDEIIIRLGGEVGLRSFEVPQIQRRHVQREVVQDEDYFFLRVPEGKDTTGGGGKARDAYLPADVERLIHRYAEQHDPPVRTRSTRSVGR